MLISWWRSLLTISSKISPSPFTNLVRPVSGSNTLLTTLCCFSHSSFVIGFITRGTGALPLASEGFLFNFLTLSSSFCADFFFFRDLFFFFFDFFFFFFSFLWSFFFFFFLTGDDDKDDDDEDEELLDRLSFFFRLFFLRFQRDD